MPNLAYQEKANKQKYPMQDVCQREMCKRKAELLETQAFRMLPSMTTHGFNPVGLTIYRVMSID